MNTNNNKFNVYTTPDVFPKTKYGQKKQTNYNIDILGFGKFKGSNINELVETVNGKSYLIWLVKNLDNDKFSELKRRINDILTKSNIKENKYILQMNESLIDVPDDN